MRKHFTRGNNGWIKSINSFRTSLETWFYSSLFPHTVRLRLRGTRADESQIFRSQTGGFGERPAATVGPGEQDHLLVITDESVEGGACKEAE